MYNFLLFNKGLLLGTSISYAKAVYDSGNEEVISQYKRLQRLNRFLNGDRLSEFDGLSTDDAKSQSSAIERELTLYLRQNGGFTDGLNYTYSDIQNALANNEVAIEFVSFLNYSDNTSYYAAMVARHDWKEPKYVPLCKKEDLEKLISLSPDRLYGETAASENAFKLLWEPLIPYIGHKNRTPRIQYLVLIQQNFVLLGSVSSSVSGAGLSEKHYFRITFPRKTYNRLIAKNLRNSGETCR